MDLHDVRRDYQRANLHRTQLDPDPMTQFGIWLSQAHESKTLSDPTAMVIATVGEAGVPRQRTVLLKAYDRDGLVFYSNTNSAKGQALAKNPIISAHFAWLPLEQQISIEGRVELIPAEQAAEYFRNRPRGSQLAALTSEQSSPITSRKELDERYHALEAKYEGQNIPVPPYWAGFRIKPHRMEFWQGGSNRLHHRFEYLKNGETWTIQRLQP